MKTVNGVEVFSEVSEMLEPAHTALLVVDVQNDGCLPDGWFAKHGKDVSRMEQIFGPIERLIGASRESGALTVFIEQTTLKDNQSDTPYWLYFKTRDGRSETDYTLEGSWGRKTIDRLAPMEGEPIVYKNRPSAFFQTNLDLILKARGIKSVLVCGTITQGCVLATILDASFHGYYTVFARDAVQSYNLELHEVALTLLSSRYDNVLADEAVALWEK